MKLVTKYDKQLKAFLDGYFGTVNGMSCYTCSYTKCYRSLFIHEYPGSNRLRNTSTCNAWRTNY